jgi:hypothetical protein
MAKKPLSKYRKITNKSVQDDYEHNVWRSVEDMWVEMYAGYDMNPEDIKDKIMELVFAYCTFIEQDTRKNLHKMSAKRKQKYR